jgi:ATP-dependent exoDNAse (exonuclease V) alpha subunit
MLHPRKLEFILEYVRLKRLEGWKIKVIFVGDFFQLPPIGSNINSVINIFKKYEVKEFQLKEIQRSSSTLWCEALKDFRHGVLNHLIKDIELSEDYKNQKELILFAKNASVRDFNKKNHTKHLIKNIDTKDTPHKCEVKMVNVKSKDKPTPFNEVIINNLNHYIKRMVNQEEKHICCAQPYQDIMRKIITIIKKHYNAIGIDYTECFCDNEKVMIRENQNKENKLINGEIRSYEEVKDIVYEKQYSSHIDYKGDKIEFDFTFTYQPYMLAYSMTTYKSQGLSLENEYTIASEELMKSQNAFNLLYVALSRAKGYTLPKLSCPLTQDLLDIYYKRFIEHNPLVTQYI